MTSNMLNSRHRRNEISEYRGNDVRILELGTGSGCIAISMLLELPNSRVIATDVSLEAIQIAQNNARKHQVSDRISIIHSNWFENLEPKNFATQKFDYIVSNPPYISADEIDDMAVETLKYEPHIALFAEEDGLKPYYIIAENAKKFLKLYGKLVIEIGFNQAEKVCKIFTGYGYNINSVHKDLQGHVRVVVISQSTLNRSYARRIGKSLSTLQQNLLDTELPKYLFSNTRLACERLDNENRQIFLEIGFGMGEHFINQAKMNPEVLFIGVEVYLNGVANALKLAIEQNVTNFLLWPNNLDLILSELPDKILNRIYILFPDPWPKAKQKKKRILNVERLTFLQRKLKNNGNLLFASDIENYFKEAVKLIKQNPDFQILNEDNYLQYYDNYIITKYHQKAINEGRTAQFLKTVMLSI